MESIKTVGSSGQISLGKQYAGRHVLVDEAEPGLWIIKAGKFIPDNELWLHQPDVRAALDRSSAWAEQNPPAPTDLDLLEAKIRQMGNE